MAVRLVIDEGRGDEGYRIGWELEDGSIELHLGPLSPMEAAELDDHAAACKAVELIVGQTRDGIYYFDSKLKAQDALRAARTAVKAALAKRPMPAWAQAALAAGWRPPRGWTP